MQNSYQHQLTSLFVDDNSKQLILTSAIRELTMFRFSSQFKSKFKQDYLTSNVYTVICSIGFFSKVNSEFQIVAVANGTKSLPQMIYRQHQKMVIKDMHAEILVIKALRRFLAREMGMVISGGQSKNFKISGKTGKVVLDQERYGVFLWSSEPFCGDCSVQESGGFFSGAKPLTYFQSKLIPNEKFQKHVLRTKPGRMDLPQNKKSLSLSCSDKLALYNTIGIQGKQLFHKLQPLYIDLFIIQSQSSNQFHNNYRTTSPTTTIRQGLDFIYRLSRLKQCSLQIIKRKMFNIVIDGKQKRISNQFRSYHQPKIIQMKKSMGQNIDDTIIATENNNNEYLVKKKQKQGFQLSLIDSNGYVQWINSKTGLPQGSSLNNYMKKGKISQFSKKRFLEYIQLENIYQSQVKDEIFKYIAIKQRIKLLFGIWTDSFKVNINNNQNKQSTN